MNQANENQDVPEALLAAFTQAVQQGEEILASVLEKNPAFFKANSKLNDKVVERMQKGRVLTMQNSPASDESELDHKRPGLSTILPPARFFGLMCQLVCEVKSDRASEVVTHSHTVFAPKLICCSACRISFESQIDQIVHCL